MFLQWIFTHCNLWFQSSYLSLKGHFPWSSVNVSILPLDLSCGVTHSGRYLFLLHPAEVLPYLGSGNILAGRERRIKNWVSPRDIFLPKRRVLAADLFRSKKVKSACPKSAKRLIPSNLCFIIVSWPSPTHLLLKIFNDSCQIFSLKNFGKNYAEIIFNFKCLFLAVCVNSAYAENANLVGYESHLTKSQQQNPLALNGMVTSPHYLATQAGLDILRRGGTAVDAAIGLPQL